MGRRETCIENIAPDADHRSCIEHGIDPATRVIAHHKAAELQSAVCMALITHIIDFHTCIIVLQIAAVGIGAEVTPFTDH